MALDGITIRVLTEELNSALSGGRIDKIHQPEKDELIIGVRSPKGNHKLIVSANSNLARVYLTETTKENPEKAPLFCMFLRKHIGSGRIISVTQPGFERVIEIKIESYNELGDLTTKRLIIEIMNKHSNIILVGEDNIILNAIKHVDLTVSSIRQVLPGLYYSYPPSQDKLNPLECDKAELSARILKEWENGRADKAVLNSVIGISPLLSREICSSVLSIDPPYNTKPEQILADRVSNRIMLIYKNASEGRSEPCVIYDENAAKYIDFSCIEIAQYKGLATFKRFETMSAAMDCFYSVSEQMGRLALKKSELLKLIDKNLERCAKKLNIQMAAVSEAANREELKVFGELLSANIYQINTGLESVRVENYYDPELKQVVIPLDPKLSPAKNVQKYFSRYNKAKMTEIEANKQIGLTNDEIQYLESVRDPITRAEALSDLSAIKDELAEQGYIKRPESKKIKGKKANKKSADSEFNPLVFETSDGFTVLVGKNNKQNDILTLKKSHGTDLWFHTKNIPGSHTVIPVVYGEEISQTAILEAAQLAAYHSKARDGENVPVDYTIIKNVKKPSGAKPGMVIYDKYNTVYVTPKKP